MYVTICMRLYLADRFLENRGVWDNMYETIYTTQIYNSNIVSRVTFKAQHPATNVQWRPSKKGFHFVLSFFLTWKFRTSFIWCGTMNYLLPNNKGWLTKCMLDSRWWSVWVQYTYKTQYYALTTNEIMTFSTQRLW